MRFFDPKSTWTALLLIVPMLAFADGNNRTNLLTYENKKGQIIPVKTKSDWQKRRAEILAGMQEVMGPLPGKNKRCPLDVQIEEETNCGSYVRRRITYASEPGSRVPAYLLIPKSAVEGHKKASAVLCLHPTEMNIGYKVVVGLGGKEHRAYASELAQRGFIALCPSYPKMANYQPDLKGLGYESGTMKAIWDNIRGLDLLDSLPFVKKNGYAAIGHSLGGHNSIYTAVFDPRIKVIVSSCGFDSFRDYQGGNIKGWTSDRYMPRLFDYPAGGAPFDFYELIGALAPRVCFINAPLQDSNFRVDSVNRIVAEARRVYELYGVPGNLTVAHPDCGHDLPDPVREEAFQVIERNLK